MITSEFLLLLLIVSTLTGLITEGMKKILTNYKSNILAGTVAVVVAILVGAAYIVLIEAALTAALFVYLIALVLLSWLCAMLGYDKVIQTLSQLKGSDVND